jgi:bifunctional polynucleotide phosphatase/kinase
VWENESTLFIADYKTKPSAKIASFDMDDTLIRVKSGAKFPKDSNDWVFWDEKVP